jgi:hypothetical protein
MLRAEQLIHHRDKVVCVHGKASVESWESRKVGAPLAEEEVKYRYEQPADNVVPI